MDIVSDGSSNNTAYVLTGKTLLTVDLATGTPTTLGEVAGPEPSVLSEVLGGFFGQLPVFRKNVRAAHLQAPRYVQADGLVLFVADADFRLRQWLPHGSGASFAVCIESPVTSVLPKAGDTINPEG